MTKLCLGALWRWEPSSGCCSAWWSCSVEDVLVAAVAGEWLSAAGCKTPHLLEGALRVRYGTKPSTDDTPRTSTPSRILPPHRDGAKDSPTKFLPTSGMAWPWQPREGGSQCLLSLVSHQPGRGDTLTHSSGELWTGLGETSGQPPNYYRIETTQFVCLLLAPDATLVSLRMWGPHTGTGSYWLALESMTLAIPLTGLDYYDHCIGHSLADKGNQLCVKVWKIPEFCYCIPSLG